MKLVDVSVKRPVGVFMIVLAILALGWISLRNLAIDLYPKIDIPIAVVATNYQGAAPQEIEKLISKPLEDSMSSVQGIDTIQSQSQANSSLVILQFQSGVDLDSALLEVREKVDQVKGFLPEDANEPSVLRFDPQQIPVMWIGLSGDKPENLQNIAENQIIPFMERQEGVGSVSISGGKTREILVELDRAKLRQYGVVPGQVTQALFSANSSASAGSVPKGDQSLQIRIEGEFQTVDDIKNTLISLPTGQQIRISDIADVKDTFKKVQSKAEVNYEEALVLSVLKQSDGNTVKVADEMYKAIDRLNEDLPEGVELSIVIDTSTFIRQSITSVVNNMIVGGLLAGFILLLFLRSIRATIVIGLSIPIAIISTFSLMYFTGQTLNILSMGGLALGIGMMVDSSIVILENIFSYRQQGYSIKEAAVKGGSELASAVIASTTTSLVVFLPIVFVQGLASDLFTALALTVSFSLLASLVVSLTLIPMLSSKLLTREKDFHKEKPSPFERAFGKFVAFYKGVLRWVLNHRKTTIAVSLGTLIGSFALAPMLGATFIPASDQGQIEISVKAPSGTRLEETEKVTDQVTKLLDPYNDVVATSYLSFGGNDFDPTASGVNLATYTIQLVKPGEREIKTIDVVQELGEAVKDIAGAEIKVSELGAGLGTGAPIQIAVNGSDQEVLEEIAQQIVWVMEDVPGVLNPETSAAEGLPEIQIEVKRDVAAQYGLTYQAVMNEVSLSFNGQTATRYREDGNEYDVRVILPEDERNDINSLQTLKIQTPTGQVIPLSAVAELKQIQGPVVIQRQNQQRQINVTSDIVDRDLGSVTRDIQAELAKINLPDGYSYSMGGQSEDMMESFADLGLALIFSIFLVYVVMAVQFESLLYPFVIMFSMPMTLVGIIGGLFITGHPLSIPAVIGVIMLSGIVVNNAIVLVDYINILRRRGMDRAEAILEAGPTRMRPIFMTTLTTVLGMVPLALGLGEGAEAQAPLAVVIIFGLSISTMFTLLLVPVMYTYLDDLSNWFGRLFSGKLFKRGGKVKEEEVSA
ncbi:efflux RND transporter permease subunit [Bacillus sp. HMF5848]|uniref:efflux RND transporter permease subunit n=1 Tax=Bacillus sp. HMF5848 TaxID=2495421 RepID=UPI000F7B348A|nr:efflux RND transporter permease subunit [Bacillus sp. HMF5848]RSK28645.1 efflux RND transporter permease subunit [Bacillus sp. HMF5848]